MMKELERRLERIAELVEQVEAGSDPASKALAKELLQSVMQLHGSGLARIMELARTSDGLVDRFARDRQICALLLVHDLHPWDAETRVREALQAHNGKVEVLRLDASSVHVRVDGSASLVHTVEEALRDAAPDIDSIVVERQEPLVVLERRR